MASIKAGYYSVGDVFKAVGFDFGGSAAADYLDGQPDFRRVQVGGLAFDSLDDKITIPVTADVVEITLDGEVVESLDVDLDAAQKKERAYSFSTAADAEDTRFSGDKAKDE